MEIYDENRKLIDEKLIDLNKGHLSKSTKIKDGAIPIDNITKFAWATEEYEEITIYVRDEVR